MKLSNTTPQIQLCRAAQAGDYLAVQSLLKSGVDAASTGNQALNAACKAGHKAIAKLLLEYGANPFQCWFDIGGRVPLPLVAGPAICWAARRDGMMGRFELIPLLLTHGPCPPEALARAVDAMFNSSPCADIAEVLAALLIHHTVNRFGADEVLHFIAARHVAFLVREHRANPEARFKFGRNALERAVDHLDVAKVQELLAYGANPNGVPRDHSFMTDPDRAQNPEDAWQILRLVVNAPGSQWTMPPGKLAELL